VLRRRLEPDYDLILDEVRASELTVADETGLRELNMALVR
jgi:hypothetical protein